MNNETLKSILDRHNVENSEQLANALSEIFNDSYFIRELTKQISKRQEHDERFYKLRRGIRP